MLLRQETLARIERGEIDTAVRCWKRPTVRAGGRLRTTIGELSIDEVDVVDEADLTDEDARRAGYDSAADALAAVHGRDGSLYRIRFHLAGPDARVALRENADLSADDVAAITARLDRMDRSSTSGPWTAAVLAAIAAQPAVRAPDLAAAFGWDTPTFKTRVRRLKELGLTESLAVGYRLSPRGQAYRSKR